MRRWWVLCAVVAAPLARSAEPGPDVDAGLSPLAQRPLWELGVGVGALRLPDYAGSDQSRNYAVPVPYVVYRGQWLKADREGARAVLFDAPSLSVDLSAAAHPPTRSADNQARQGMPNLPGTIELGPNANYTLVRSPARHWKLDLRLPVRAAVTLQHSPQYLGLTFSPHLNLDLSGGSERWNVGVLSGPQFADHRYHALYYSVGPGQALADRPAYQAAGGYAGWQSLASCSVRFGSTWVGAFARWDDLHGTVFADSPLVRRANNLTVGLAVSWILSTSTSLVASTD